MTTTRRATCSFLLMLLTGLAVPGLSGCGEADPPPLSKEGMEAAKQDREVIIQKEYGQKAFQKGQAAEKARSK